jgi:butyryl-CoA dehydrogenase
LIGGTEEQRSRLLPPFLKQAGAPLAGFCATEPGGSANVASPPPGEGVRTTARFSANRWIIQGRKSWISSATGWDRKGADLLSVLCRTDPDAPAERGTSIILVECPTPGLVFERAIDSLGHRAHLLPQFALEGVSVPGDNVLGNLGGGLALTAASFIGAAALVGIFAVGVMRMGFDFALGFARKSQEHFARVFRSVCGASPTEYRQEFAHRDQPSASEATGIPGWWHPSFVPFTPICVGRSDKFLRRFCPITYV